MSSPRNILAGLAVALVAAFISSCSSSTEGIFASIEREQKIVSLGGLSETATVTSMAELGGTVDRYFATGGKALFSRSTDTSTRRWTNSTVAGQEVASIGAVHGSVERLFAVAGGKLYGSDNGSQWSAIDGLDSGDRAEALVPVRRDDGVSNEELMVVTSTSSAYRKVYRIDNSAGLSAAIILSSEKLAAPVHSAVLAGTDVFLASETHLWKLATDLSVTSVANSAILGHDFSGILYLGSGVESGAYEGFYITTLSRGNSGGGLYKAKTDTDPWGFTGLETGVESTLNGDPVGLGSILYNEENKSLWIATGAATNSEGAGYMEYILSSDSFLRTPRTNPSNYTSSNLASMAVGTLFRSSSGLYFLGTASHGLWLWDSAAANSTDRTWSQQ